MKSDQSSERKSTVEVDATCSCWIIDKRLWVVMKGREVKWAVVEVIESSNVCAFGKEEKGCDDDGDVVEVEEDWLLFEENDDDDDDSLKELGGGVFIGGCATAHNGAEDGVEPEFLREFGFDNDAL